MTDVTTDDLIGHALDKNPEGFRAAFNDVMVDRIAAAIEGKRQEVAAEYFSDEEAVEADEAATDQEESETETEEEQHGQEAE